MASTLAERPGQIHQLTQELVSFIGLLAEHAHENIARVRRSRKDAVSDGTPVEEQTTDSIYFYPMLSMILDTILSRVSFIEEEEGHWIR